MPTVQPRPDHRDPLDSLVAVRRNDRQDERDFSIEAFEGGENGVFHPIATRGANNNGTGVFEFAFPESMQGTSVFPMDGYQMSDDFDCQEKPSSFHSHVDSMQLFAPQCNEAANDLSEDHMAFGVPDYRLGDGANGFGEDRQSSLQDPRRNIGNSLKPSAAGPYSRIVNTPHGPALLLKPAQGSSASGVLSSSVNSSGRPRKFQRWSEEEDEILRYAVNSEDESKPNWKKISSTFFEGTRSALQCKSRWNKSLQPGLRLGSWGEHEDEIILHLRAEGFKWSQIADQLPGRIGEHVRDRYVNFLDPDLKKTPWTKEEDKILYEQQKIQGNKWTTIANFLPGRSENAVKNRWHNAKMTQRRRMRKHAAERSLVAQSMRARQHAATTRSDDESSSDEEDGVMHV